MLGEWRNRLHKTSGGLSDTEAKELTVSPDRRPSGAAAVTTVTPVGKQPSASRKSRALKGACAASGSVSAIGETASVAGRLIMSGSPKEDLRARGRNSIRQHRS